MPEVPQPSTDGAAPASAGAATEPLSCVSCRARKLKCDRTHPACTRCLKVGSECVYPESRRKPAFKRRNVKELEARLGTFPVPGSCLNMLTRRVAQVEDYLKEANRSGGNAPEDVSAVPGDASGYHPYSVADANTSPVEDEAADTAQQARASPDVSIFTGYDSPKDSSQPSDQPAESFGDTQLIALGLTEGLPPFELMEEL
jgi:hypothetical protein